MEEFLEMHALAEDTSRSENDAPMFGAGLPLEIGFLPPQTMAMSQPSVGPVANSRHGNDTVSKSYIEVGRLLETRTTFELRY